MKNKLMKTHKFMINKKVFPLFVLVLVACVFLGCDFQKKDFTIVVLPDTQFYTQKYTHIFTCQTQWIRDHAKSENIKFVLHVGDITEHNIDEEWKRANQSMSLLDGCVPYSLCLGNHEMGSGSTETRFSRFDNYFGYSRYQSEKWYGGHMGDSNRNHYCFFEGGGMKFMVVSLEFGPTDAMLQWANEIIEQHPDRRVIILTHAYMADDDTRQDLDDRSNPHLERESFGEVNNGEEMWEKLVKKHKNIFFVISGHIHCDRLSHLTSTGIHGNKVHQVLADYQHMENGGNGYLVIAKFVPRENKFYLSTYSPFLKEALTIPGNNLEFEFK